MNNDFWIGYRIKEDRKLDIPKKSFADMSRREARKYSKLMMYEVAFAIVVAITLLFS